MNTLELESPARHLASLASLPGTANPVLNTADATPATKLIMPVATQSPARGAKSESRAREVTLQENVSPPHRLQSAVLKLPRNCIEIRRFIGRWDQLTGLVNEKYWGTKLEELDRSLAQFNECLVWATVLTFHSPAYRVGWNRGIACSARDEQNIFVASISHDFVFYSRGSAQRGTRLTEMLINGHPVSLLWWLKITVAERLKVWKSCMRKWNPENGPVTSENAGIILRPRLEEIDVKCAAVNRFLEMLQISNESSPSTPTLADEVRRARADLAAARAMINAVSKKNTRN